ncbi:unnamed protein product [Diatraea saccharalis]|uniref:Carboxylic ester hydrolase n=1 Tax=Diatraea saccharalis TaxID=40085 RepID=A0A9N9W984_9NEOP|nr:unnamed protein product [Diatraea saccharalis]
MRMINTSYDIMRKRMKHGKRIVLFTLFAMNLIDQPAPYVKIEQGTLSGKISSDGSFFEYLGIPYATSNRETRFKAPLPPPKWNGVYKAIDEMYGCPQPFLLNIVSGTEDCLKANVYVPAKSKGPLPVMVYIHGGAFFLGSGGKLLYGPEFIVKNDVILVTFNYRLGALGFICLGTEEAPGNAGLKDQIAALRWVKNNIAAFGGDPNNVTIFGESAGSVSVSILLLSKATLGLFNRAILQSGSSLSNWAINRKPVWIASLLVKDLGYDTEDPKEIYDILYNLPYQDLIKLKPVKPLGMFFDTLLLHLPCIEKPDIPGNEPVLTDLPYNLLINNPRNVSVIHGSTSREGLLLTPGETEAILEERNQRYFFASDLIFKSDDEANKTSSKIKEFYFGNERLSRNNILKLEKMYTELYLQFPTALEADILVSSWNIPVYSYFFNYSGGRNALKSRAGSGNETGACHADDIFYLFNARLWPFSTSKKDEEFIELLTRMWTNFAKYGYVYFYISMKIIGL